MDTSKKKTDSKKSDESDESGVLSDEEMLKLWDEINKSPSNLPNIDPEEHRLYRIYGESIPESGEG
jgi:hypothetical protein